jgi:hypothetical protein
VGSCLAAVPGQLSRAGKINNELRGGLRGDGSGCAGNAK